MRVRLALLVVLAVAALPAAGKPTQRYYADFRSRFTVAAATDNAAIQFLIDGTGIKGGLQPGDVDISILKGSRFASSLIAGQTLKLTPIANGDLLVQIVGDIRSPVANTQFIDFRVEILRPNVKKLKITNPKWGDSNPLNNHDFAPLGAATVTGGAFVLDPLFVAFNDVEGGDLLFRNLQFLNNASQATVDALDVAAIFGMPYDSGLPQFTLGYGMSTDDLPLMLDVGPEPDWGRYLVAMGQVVDPASGETLSAFIHGVQVVPEPGLLPVAGALAGAAALAFARRRRRCERRC